MVCLKYILMLAACAFSSASGNAEFEVVVEKRQGTFSIDSVTCGSNRYNRQQVDAATAEGCRLYATRKKVGSNDYPHQFNNRESLVFASSGPYQEFPILSSGQNYTGRAPGPDRVVFNPTYQGRCTYMGTMTHTGAPTDSGFVLCSQTQSQATMPSSTPRSAAPALTVLGFGAEAGSISHALLSLLLYASLCRIIW